MTGRARLPLPASPVSGPLPGPQLTFAAAAAAARSLARSSPPGRAEAEGDVFAVLLPAAESALALRKDGSLDRQAIEAVLPRGRKGLVQPVAPRAGSSQASGV